ncbi:MAG: hypothetical protein KME57_28485 [Scytonema hyalinum WJT4-NPBG1]|nr:hypothetical protein [Scytonema hyalinum WJT4-NPBG1]
MKIKPQMDEAVRCGEPAPFGAFPSAGDWCWHKPQQDLRAASPEEIATAVQMQIDK